MMLAVVSCSSSTRVCELGDALCSSGGERVPTTVTLAPASVDLSSLGETRQLIPAVVDQNGLTITGASGPGPRLSPLS